MKRTRNSYLLALLAALLILAGNISLRAAAEPQATQPADPTTTSTTKSAKKKNSAADSTAATPASKPASPSTPAAPATPAKPAAAPAQAPSANSSGMVWVNTESGVYHMPGSRYYGKTKQRKYMTEADALKAGYRPAAKK